MPDVRLSDPPAPAVPRPAAASSPGRGQVGAVALVVGGIFSQQFGSAVANLLFDRVGAPGVVTLRLTVSAMVLLALCRPALRGHRRGDWAVVVAFGVALGGMNLLFYQALARIPLGTAVTLEVLGPLVLSVVAARRASSWLWAALALAGVVLLGRGDAGGGDLAGAAFALGAGAMWAAYILLASRAGSRFPKADGLALAMAVGALLSLPAGTVGAGSALLNPVALALGAAVALLSSVLPYTLELMSLRRLPAGTFAVLMSLAPAVAALAGRLVLGQDLGTRETLAILLVVAASAGAVRASVRSPLPGRSAGRTEP
ncbi:EamA family transporter [Streptomyces sp. CoH17]|uniref:EamA family transporter n=1 Tax=Streptomyces sp. CoH17 TaxID=2992806 RepID=UPI00226E435C|nr:EamA family transporter [Streptomyces sp. CoH17]